jgi:hypothetical protein
VLARLAVVVALAAPSGRADDKAPPVPTSEHVSLRVAGKPLAGWTVDADAKDGTVLLGDDGAFVKVVWGPSVTRLGAEARPVTEIPGAALVTGLSYDGELVRDRCQEWLGQRGAEAAPLLAQALQADVADARRRALAVLEHGPIDSLASSVKSCVRDSDERVRAEALAAYAALKRPDALSVCIDRADSDSSLLVQHAAAEQIGFLHDLHGVDPLLRLLGATEDRGVKIVVFASLRRITGMKFGRDEDAWRAWWTNHREELLPDSE